jgi:hypothetical protein
MDEENVYFSSHNYSIIDIDVMALQVVKHFSLKSHEGIENGNIIVGKSEKNDHPVIFYSHDLKLRRYSYCRRPRCPKKFCKPFWPPVEFAVHGGLHLAFIA